MANTPQGRSPIEIYTIEVERDFAKDCDEVLGQIGGYADMWQATLAKKGDAFSGHYEPTNSPEGLRMTIDMSLHDDVYLLTRVATGSVDVVTREYVLNRDTGDLQIAQVMGEQKGSLEPQSDEERYAYLTDLSWAVFLASDIEHRQQ